MNRLGRRMPCSSRARGLALRRLTLATRWAGRLLCWSLAAGMATAASDLLLDPQAGWWHLVWPLPWYLTCVAALAWAKLRVHEKGAQGPSDEDFDLKDDWGQAA